MYFTTARWRVRGVPRKNAFNNNTAFSSCLWGSRKGEYPVCDCACVLDCVRVSRERMVHLSLGARRAPASPSKETATSRFALLVLCPWTGENWDECAPPPLLFTLLQSPPFVWADDIVPLWGKILHYFVRKFMYKKGKKNTAVSLSYRVERINVARAYSSAALPMWTPLNKNFRAFITSFFFFFRKGKLPTLRADVRNASGFGCQVIFVSWIVIL